MVDVVGKDVSVAKSCTCNNCGSILRYYKKDIYESISTDYTGGKDINYFINCPSCSKTVTVRRF